MKHLRAFTNIAAGVAMAAMAAGAVTAHAADKSMPGQGKTIKMARATWDTGWWQAEVYRQLFEKLGYDVPQVTTLDNPPFYQSVAQGDMDLWVNGWFPLHNTYADTFKQGAQAVGYVAKGGALQGYLIDKKTADKYGIKYLSDMKKPKIAKLFDTNGDGKANMVACPPGWGCETLIAYQMDAYGLRDSIDLIKAGYSASMADALSRYKNGEPIFFYTWTPNWTVGLLKPGKDVVWLQVKETRLPKDQANLKDKAIVKGVEGCADDPCRMGMPANDIRPVANSAFLKDNPAVETLLEEVRIPVQDIFAQNAKMNQGADSPEDLKKQAADWIARHQDKVDRWLKDARAAAMM
ncbi:glycine betaine/proline transport system substrate-binding protein [Tistlia consotensis]|uniref:Glycine betaine/proline transport system substrate-binding protein n=1 Tax=Tistlia consotensis USBA 355 TaxID=560819 RepID=A0A1Y6BSG5_9PROT|nr:glycine betaine/L-proline ABC transporter substrate-binding protein ProX [Tistlia consotensis]SMF18631.1 glycine betaine/proline transport system substrate-binding protein [Tistlia consotensis USBA 355]SNR39557.1 glycine betaine/proline transport system substrate-binding protein [Tistlia consotensis]